MDFIEIRWISSKTATQTHDDTDEEKDRFDKERAKSVGVRESQTRGLRGLKRVDWISDTFRADRRNYIPEHILPVEPPLPGNYHIIPGTLLHLS